MNLCEPINPGSLDDNTEVNAYCACLKSCGCGQAC
jgi:hypothetical protein